MDKAGLIAALFDDVFDPGFFAERLELADKLDLNTVLLSDALSVLPDFFLKRFGELVITEYLDLVRIKK